ncbi:hypothetical protein GGR39_002386 [Novosphingobium fluoreni]|uniref:Uncharacterized protein n=1 Tax=Novosphingobium fluoreni TaxID=1391222 RepID=A0A7W6BZF8_9SPHN|nr:hypothetical protein [Novosphingobium fluoreni]MBB3940729.1 hypothetical protein [Novosphingobium fluoreni]
MNLRILKKLSKRAAPYLPLFGDTREQFRSGRGDNYHGLIIRDRTCFERSPCHSSYAQGAYLWGGEVRICVQARAGHRYMISPPPHPLKGTIMVGGMSGYYEPEWDEETAFGALRQQVCYHFTDWEACASIDDVPGITRDLSTVSKLFAAADEMVRKRYG